MAATPPPPPLLLRPVGKGRPIDRQSALSMWKTGQVVGLFNLPNEDAFNACQDFCIEDSALLLAEQEAVISLKTQLKAAIDKSVQTAKDALEAKEKLAEESKQHLIDLEQYEHDKSKFETERQNWKKERKALQKTIENHLAEIKRLNSDHLEVQQLKNSFREREAELAAERQAAVAELQEQLKDERSSMAVLFHENRDLNQRIRLLEAENAQLRQSTVELTTTDLMNRSNQEPAQTPSVSQPRSGGLTSILSASELMPKLDSDASLDRDTDEDDDSWA